MPTSIVTRFPPSPTGPLHIGGARTALYCWAFARHHGGRFLLRFEDTDRERSSEASEAAMLASLAWLGLDGDPVPGFDGIPRQSERAERYGGVLDELLSSGAAYRCTCTAERLAQLREAGRASGSQQGGGYDGFCRDKGIAADCGEPFCVRLRVPEDGPTRWNDLVAGPSGQDAADLGDFVIARTDGTPIYHLAVVVDDHDMEVTHVIRGREHMSSTSRQLLLYAALGWEAPAFAHAPLLTNAKGRKLSKREAAVSVDSYRERGIPPEAVLNFIARLGWGHGDVELFDRDELVRLFDLDGIGKSPAQIDDDKLHWVSQHYLKTLPADALLAQLQPFLDARAGRAVDVDGGLAKLVDLLRERSKTLVEMADQAGFYLDDEITYEPKAARKHLRPEAGDTLTALRDSLAGLGEWAEPAIEQAFRAVADDRGMKLGALAQPTRVALVGGTASPGIFETLELLGRERSLARLDAALAHLGAA